VVAGVLVISVLLSLLIPNKSKVVI